MSSCKLFNICLSRLRACPGGDFAAFVSVRPSSLHLFGFRFMSVLDLCRCLLSRGFEYKDDPVPLTRDCYIWTCVFLRSEEMASLRRSTSAVKRDNSLQNDHENLDTSFSKPSHTRTYMILIRLLNSLVNSLDFLMNLDRIRACIHSISLQRPVRSVERSKAKGQFLKGAVFRLFICFIVGIFYGYTAIPSVDTSKNSASRDQVFSFHEDSANIEKRMISVGKDIIPIQKKMQKENIDLDIALNLQMENKTLNTSFSKISRDLELVSGKLLIVVTPTSGRPFQLYYLNRLAQTLRNLPAPFLWIVVEMQLQSAETSKLLRETGVMYRHLFCDKNVTCIKERSICQRNVALYHIEKHRLVGIVYFADVDKIYSVETFKEMREISSNLREIQAFWHLAGCFAQ